MENWKNRKIITWGKPNMRIEQGFGKFTEGERIEVELLQIKYTKNNHRPYAVVDAGEGKFNVNIKDSDTECTPGKYIIECTGVNAQGCCYINLEKLQHTSWDKRDQAMQKAEPTGYPKCEEPKPSNDLAYNINLTKHYHDNLRYTSLSPMAMDEIGDSIHHILEILYQAYGVTKYNEVEQK